MFGTTLCLLMLSATASEMAPQRAKADISLKEWLSEGECFNMALVPQYNNQHSILGLLNHLQEEGLLDKLTGISASSAGSLPAAVIAAGKSPKDFVSAFPENGWMGFSPSEPQLTEDYTSFLQKILPETFEELKTPFALTATAWESEDALKKFDKEKSKEIVLKSGKLYPAMIAAIATGHSGLINDPNCPKCTNGFWPRAVEAHEVVTDGSYTDIWGTRGMKSLPKCDRLVHVLPVDYQGQTDPQPAAEIAGSPKEVVTLIVSQPPIASHSHFQEFIKKSGSPAFTEKSTKDWNDKVFQHSRMNMKESTGNKMLIEKAQDDTKHYVVTIDNVASLRKEETFNEKVYDAFMETMKDSFWKVSV